MLLLKDFIFISICLQRAASKHHILAAVFCYMKQKPAKKGLSSGEKIMIVLIIHMTGSMTCPINGKGVSKENPKSDFDLDLGFVKKKNFHVLKMSMSKLNNLISQLESFQEER